MKRFEILWDEKNEKKNGFSKTLNPKTIIYERGRPVCLFSGVTGKEGNKSRKNR